jgi:hypothetical protein
VVPMPIRAITAWFHGDSKGSLPCLSTAVWIKKHFSTLSLIKQPD